MDPKLLSGFISNASNLIGTYQLIQTVVNDDLVDTLSRLGDDWTSTGIDYLRDAKATYKRRKHYIKQSVRFFEQADIFYRQAYIKEINRQLPLLRSRKRIEKNSAKRLAVSILGASASKFRGDDRVTMRMVKRIVESYTHYYDSIKQSLNEEELQKMTSEASQIVAVASNRVITTSYDPELSWTKNTKGFYKELLNVNLDEFLSSILFNKQEKDDKELPS